MVKRRAAAKKTAGRSTAVLEREVPPSDAIRRAAFDLFARQGFNITTVRDIMHACGLTQGALYNHFASKDELLAALIIHTQDELERLLLDAVEKAGEDPVDQLFAYARAYAMRHTRNRVEALVANREFAWLEHTKLVQVRSSRRRVREILINLLKRGAKTKAIRLPHSGGKEEVKMTAMAILNMCTDIAYYYAPGGAWSDEAVADLHARMALRIVGVER
jgi:AcrR family transcriptional regulator